MRTIKVVAVMSVLATLTLFVGTVPGSAADSFDLTAGPVTVSYTLDLSQAQNIAWDWNWANASYVGLFSGGAGAQMFGGLVDWGLPQSPTYPDNDASQDIDDKFNLQRFPNPGNYDESVYDVICTNPPTLHANPVVPGNNRGVWFDRDGVDQFQALNPLNVDGATYNTLGVYDVGLTFTRIGPTTVAVCPTVNGIPTTYYTTFSPTLTVDFEPAGISFQATEAQMRTMAPVTSAGPGIVIEDLEVSGVATYTTEADCVEGETFVSSLGGSESLPAVAGHKYLIEARGTYYAGGDTPFDIRADAQYSQDAIQRAADPDADWTTLVNRYEDEGEVLLDLTVDAQNVDWGAYSADHEYAIERVATGGTIEFAFAIYDIYYTNNTGGLCVSMEDLGNIGTFEGFFAPVDNLPTVNAVKAGQTVPVKWRLLDWNGDPVSDPGSVVGLTSTRHDCDTGCPLDALETAADAGDSGLQYLGDGYWQFNWKTPKAYVGQCRTMTLELSDGSTYTAEFQFK